MQDPDDFFTDDIIFDDQTLALLDECEQKFASQIRLPAKRDSPPPKRQKTTNESGARRYGTGFVEDWEDLPEISVRGDGTYGLQAAALSVATNRPTSQATVARVNGPVVASAQAQPATRSSIGTGQPGRSRVPTPAITRAPSASSQTRPPSFRHQNSRPLIRNTPPPRHNQSNTQIAKATAPAQDEAAQVAELRRQVEEVAHLVLDDLTG